MAPQGEYAPYVSGYPEPIDVVMPANAPTITQQFRRPDTFSPQGQKWAEHQGVDVHAKVGTPVIAAASGTVESSVFDPAYGNVVQLLHQGAETYRTRYAHLSQRNVTRGQQVQRGEVIGELGATGALSGAFPHVHFELWQTVDGRKRVPVDPHLKWAKGVGRVTCFEEPLPSGNGFSLTYPVPCK